MNTRRVLIKIVLVILIVWVLLIGAWLALPFTQHEDAADSDLLVDGKVLSRMYTLNDYYPYTDRTPAVVVSRRTSRYHFVVDAKLSNDTLVLGIRHDSLAFKVGGEKRLHPYHSITLAIPDKNASITVSEPFVFSSRAADSFCGNTNILPGPADNVDIALSCWWFHHDWFSEWEYNEIVKTTMRTRTIPDNNTIELWSDSYYWRRPDSPWNPPKMGPLLTIQLTDARDPVFTFATGSSSPSRFYRARLGILILLYPLTLAVVGTFKFLQIAIVVVVRLLVMLVSFIAQIVSVLLGLAVLLGIGWWLRSGRPPLPVRDIKDAVAEVIQSARRGRIQLPPDQDPDLEAQPQGSMDETEGVESSQTPADETVTGGSSPNSNQK